MAGSSSTTKTVPSCDMTYSAACAAGSRKRKTVPPPWLGAAPKLPP